MARIAAQLKGPDLSSYTMRRVMVAGVDGALIEVHQRQHLPHHFTRGAYGRYPGAYGPPHPRPSKLPLVKTGLLRLSSVTGPVRLSGPLARRTATWTGLPRYTYKDNPRSLYLKSKIRALDAIAAPEESAVAAYVDNHLNQHLNSTT